MGLRNNPFMQYIRNPASEDDSLDELNSEEKSDVGSLYKAAVESMPQEVSPDHYERVMKDIKEMTVPKKEYGWGDLLIAAAPAIAGGLTGYGAAGAQAGLQTMQTQQADIAQKQKDEMDLLRVKANLMGKLKPAVAKPEPHKYIAGKEDMYAVKGEKATPLGIGVKPSTAQPKLGKYWYKGKLEEYTPQEYLEKRSAGEKIEPYTVPGMVADSQTNTTKIVNKIPGTVVTGAGATGAIGSAFNLKTPSGKILPVTKEEYQEFESSKKDYTKEQFEINERIRRSQDTLTKLKQGRMGYALAIQGMVQRYNGKNSSDRENAFIQANPSLIGMTTEKIEEWLNEEGRKARIEQEIPQIIATDIDTDKKMMRDKFQSTVNRMKTAKNIPESELGELIDPSMVRVSVEGPDGKRSTLPKSQLKAFLNKNKDYKLAK